MSLLDLSLVSTSLRDLVQTHVRGTIDSTPDLTAPPSDQVEVQVSPPEDLTGDFTIGLYLYHIAEDGHTRNLPADGRDDPPIRHAPMGLDLYYQLTASSDLADRDTATRWEQFLMGLAVKALHDYPVIDDSTELPFGNGGGGPTPVLEDALRGRENRVRVVLQPVPHDQAVSFWTAGDAPLRLSAYYQVSIILLEPEEPTLRAGRVLEYGVHAFVSGRPRLEGSESVIPFTPPGEPPRELTASPARVPTGREVTFIGSDLAGDRTELWLRTPHWDDPGRADAEWPMTVTATRVSTTPGETLEGEPVLPGVYGARVHVFRSRTMPDGSTRTFEHPSNETPFMVTPRIDGVAGDPAAVLTVTGHAFEDPRPPADAVDLEVEVYAGGEGLVAVEGGPDDPGEFTVQGVDTLELRLPAGLGPGSVPLRVRVNGADADPRWVTVP